MAPKQQTKNGKRPDRKVICSSLIDDWQEREEGSSPERERVTYSSAHGPERGAKPFEKCEPDTKPPAPTFWKKQCVKRTGKVAALVNPRKKWNLIYYFKLALWFFNGCNNGVRNNQPRDILVGLIKAKWRSIEGPKKERTVEGVNYHNNWHFFYFIWFVYYYRVRLI